MSVRHIALYCVARMRDMLYLIVSLRDKAVLYSEFEHFYILVQPFLMYRSASAIASAVSATTAPRSAMHAS